jgi:hypothetical protein
MGLKKRTRPRRQLMGAAGSKMSKAYRALLRERPELAAISDAEISAAAAAIDMVDRMTAGLSYFELLEAYARAALAAAAQVRVELMSE